MANSRSWRRVPGIWFLILASCAPVKRPAESSLRATDPGAAATLEQKLDAQFALYDAAKATLIQKVAVDKQVISRDAWEALLKGPSFDAKDLAELKERQDQDAAEARAASVQRSTLDLERLAPEEAARFCRELPKGGLLHIHLYGTLDRELVHQLLGKVDPKIDFAKLQALLDSPGGTGTLHPDELDRLKDLARTYETPIAFTRLGDEERLFVEELFFLPKGNHPFDRFTAVFTTSSALLFGNPQVDPEKPVEEAFLKRAAEHHVRYVEISRYIVPRPQWFQSLTAWAAGVKSRYDITARYVASFARNKDAEFTRGKAEQLLKLPESPGLVGVNILADESNYPALENGQTLYGPLLAAVENGSSHLHRTSHAGELGDPRNVRDMLLMGVERIGHGVKLKDDPVTLEYARKLKVPVEVNLISNLRLQVVPSIKEHPYLKFLRLGLPVSLSTDDEGIFETTIDDECLAAVRETDVTYDELKEMARNGVRTGFADADTKARVLAEVDADFVAFEKAWARLAKGH